MPLAWLTALNDYLQRHGDPRVTSWPLMTSMWPNLALCFSYLLMLSLIRCWMSFRQPFRLRSLMIAYNAFMVVFNAFIFVELMRFAWGRGHSFRCGDVDRSASPDSLRVVRVGVLFWFVKIVEFADTFLFALRKRDDRISFLHVFHHFATPLSLWFAIRVAPGGHGVFFATLNSLVHAIMYGYYGLAALGPRFRSLLWWKIWLTRMQLAQFVAVCLHSLQLFFDNSCQYPIVFTYVLAFYSVVFFALFVNFYRKSYLTSDAPTGGSWLKRLAGVADFRVSKLE